MKSKYVWLTLLLVLFAGTTAAGFVFWKKLQLAATQPGTSDTIQKFEVLPGSSMRAVLQSLQRQNLIRDARMLEWYLRCCQRGTKLALTELKAGRYRIVPGQPPIEIVRQLVEGRVLLEKLTVLEGWTFAQMREYLTQQPELGQTLPGRTEAEIMAELGAPDLPAEGRFAPDTYSYSPGVTTDMQILAMAFAAQQRYLQEAWDARQPGLPLQSADDALTLASIIEKETGLGSERARVAGVFVNRLRKKMLLQTDPTVIYGMGDRYDGNLRKSDLRRDTPYNTYTRPGLPPTPIALPGRKAIIAAVNPEKTDALFFVATGDGSGGHCFSATMEQHSLCVQVYLERLRNPPEPTVADQATDYIPVPQARNPDEPPP